jgi:hypothetical protein
MQSSKYYDTGPSGVEQSLFQCSVTLRENDKAKEENESFICH